MAVIPPMLCTRLTDPARIAGRAPVHEHVRGRDYYQ